MSESPTDLPVRKDALELYTINNTYASFEEILKGLVEKSKLAHMVMLSK